jgi:hypothetical protein
MMLWHRSGLLSCQTLRGNLLMIGAHDVLSGPAEPRESRRGRNHLATFFVVIRHQYCNGLVEMEMRLYSGEIV